MILVLQKLFRSIQLATCHSCFRRCAGLRCNLSAGHVVHHAAPQDQEADPGGGRPLLVLHTSHKLSTSGHMHFLS